MSTQSEKGAKSEESISIVEKMLEAPEIQRQVDTEFTDATSDSTIRAGYILETLITAAEVTKLLSERIRDDMTPFVAWADVSSSFGTPGKEVYISNNYYSKAQKDFVESFDPLIAVSGEYTDEQIREAKKRADESRYQRASVGCLTFAESLFEVASNPTQSNLTAEDLRKINDMVTTLVVRGKLFEELDGYAKEKIRELYTEHQFNDRQRNFYGGGSNSLSGGFPSRFMN